MARVLLRGVSVPGAPFAPVDLEVDAGQRVTVADVRGTAPFLLARGLAGLLPVEGEFRIEERSVQDVPPPGRPVGFVARGGGLVDGWTVRKNVGSPLSRMGLSTAEIESRIAEAAALANAEGLLDRRADTLSMLDRQKAALARALARRPALLVCEDPGGDLDADVREVLGGSIADAVRRSGVAAVIATADPVESLWMGDRLVVWDSGAKLQEGASAAVYEQPATRSIAEWLGRPVMNLLEVPVVDGRVLFGGASFVGPAAERAVLGVRGESLRIQPVPDAVPLKARVIRTRRTGAAAHLELEIDGRTFSGWCPGTEAPRERTETTLYLRPADLRWFSTDADGRALPVR